MNPPVEVQQLQQAVLDAAKSRITNYQRRSIWASQLGHPCLRYNEYAITRWKDRQPHDAHLQLIFEEGRIHEDTLDEALKAAGFLFRQSQQPLDEVVARDGKRMKYNISGRLDREVSHKTLFPGIWVPAEFKTMADYIWQSIDTLDDMKNHRSWYIRMYPSQLNFYDYAKSRELGLFILKNKTSGAYKFIWCPLDLELAERDLHNAEDINLAVERIEADPANAENYLSPRISYDEKICGRCPFNHICLPDQQFGGVEIELDEAVETQLRKREDLKPAVAEFKELDDTLKDIFKKRKEGLYLVAGSFNVKVSTIPSREQAAYTVKEYKKVDIKALKKQGEASVPDRASSKATGS